MNRNTKDGFGAVIPRLAPNSTQWARELATRINSAAGEIHRDNAKFYKDLTTGQPIDRNPGEMLCLIHSEVSEMLEGVRKGLPDSHLPDRTAEEVEAADVLIRLLDYCCFRRLDIGGAMLAKLEYNATRADHTDEARRAAGGKKF
jgi:hypothetical protein